MLVARTVAAKVSDLTNNYRESNFITSSLTLWVSKNNFFCIQQVLKTDGC